MARAVMALVAVLVAGSGCATLGSSRTPPVLPLGNEGEVHVYVLPLPRDAERLSFTVEGVALARPDGGSLPLQVEQREISGAHPRAQRHLASARVPPGEYRGLLVSIGAANVSQDGEPARLLVEPQPSSAELDLHVRPGAAVVVWLQLSPAPIRGEFSFAPRFVATLPPRTPPQSALYCTNGASASVTVADRPARLVTEVIPAAGAPRGIAIDGVSNRAYVALYREDQLELLDLATGVPIGRISLSPGDGPTEVALAADGTLVVVNERSRTVSFVDPSAMAEVGRVSVGDGPTALVLDRSGRRAYVVNRVSATVSVLDVGRRAVFGTIATDPEPLRVGFSRDGTRLYVVHRGSTYLAAFAVPSLAPLTRVFIGLGATTLRVDPRTDLIYVSRGDERRIVVLDPISLQPIDQFDVPGAVSYMTIDDAEDTLIAVVPEQRTLAVIELTSRKLRAEIPVGAEPHAVAFKGERP